MHFIKKEIVTKETVVDSRTECDFCKENIRDDNGWECNEVTLEARVGSIYPENDNRTVYEIDCCSKCFMGKIQPLLEKTFGIKFRERDVDHYDRNYVLEK